MDSRRWRTAGLAAAVASLSCRGPERGAVLVFDAPVFNFGATLEGAALVHSFGFTNAGDRSLRIESVVSRCTCTTARAPATEVAPGGRGAVEVTFHTEGFSGMTREGVDVRSNGSPLHTVLSVQARIEPRLDYEPHYIKLVTDDPGAVSQRVRFVGRFAGDVRPSVLAVDAPGEANDAFVVRPFRDEADGGAVTGIQLSAAHVSSTSGSGRVVVDTGLGDPARLEVRFGWGESAKLGQR